MLDILKEVVPKLGIPGIFIAILIIIINSKPITTLFASSIEVKLSTKERRVVIKLIRKGFEVLIYLLLLLMITDGFFKDEKLYNPELATILYIFQVLILALTLIGDLKGKSFNNVLKNNSLKIKVILYFLCIGYLILWFILPAYFIGTQIYSDFYNKNLNENQQYGVLIAVILIYTIISLFLLPIFKIIYRFLELNIFPNKNLKIIINNKIWYIHHPIDTDLFLLGNLPDINSCDEVLLIEKNELILKNIIVENNLEDSK
ncbi:MAG: hypothetical protein K0S34_1599 [Bacillales bacterium]|nr:hypothetical protein [Bacillales bacterium]